MFRSQASYVSAVQPTVHYEHPAAIDKLTVCLSLIAPTAKLPHALMVTRSSRPPEEAS